MRPQPPQHLLQPLSPQAWQGARELHASMQAPRWIPLFLALVSCGLLGVLVLLVWMFFNSNGNLGVTLVGFAIFAGLLCMVVRAQRTQRRRTQAVNKVLRSGMARSISGVLEATRPSPAGRIQIRHTMEYCIAGTWHPLLIGSGIGIARAYHHRLGQPITLEVAPDRPEMLLAMHLPEAPKAREMLLALTEEDRTLLKQGWWTWSVRQALAFWLRPARLRKRVICGDVDEVLLACTRTRYGVIYVAWCRVFGQLYQLETTLVEPERHDELVRLAGPITLEYVQFGGQSRFLRATSPHVQLH